MKRDELSRGRQGCTCIGHLDVVLQCIIDYYRMQICSDIFRCIQRLMGFAQDPLLGAENQGGLPKSDRILEMLCEKLIVLPLWSSPP